jgi:hypothetical protein
MVSIPLYPHDIRMFHSHAPKIAANFAKAGRSNVFRINSINLHRWFREKSSHPQNIWIYDANCVYIYISGVCMYIYIYVCVYMYMCGKYAYINILYIYVWDMYMVYIYTVYVWDIYMGYIYI